MGVAVPARHSQGIGVVVETALVFAGMGKLTVASNVMTTTP